VARGSADRVPTDAAPLIGYAAVSAVVARVDPFAPATLGPLQLRNRILKSATFEGMCPGGVPSDALVEHHRNIARGGAAMTTLAYVAVAPDARTFADQIVASEATAGSLRTLTDAVHAEGAAASIQLGHCGAFTKLRGVGMPRGPSPGINAYGIAHGLPIARSMRPAEITAVVGAFERAARHAREAGFDAIELHLGHGYLLSQFLSPATNRRRDAWGGSRDARMRLPLDVVRRVRSAVPDLALLAKINLSDGIEGGADVDDAVALARALQREGIDAIVGSGGFTSRNAFYLLRGRAPIPEMIAAERHPLQRWALRLLGPRVIRSLPFEELFFAAQARVLLESVRVPIVLLGGVVSRQGLAQAMAEGFAFVAMGRALICDPDLPARMQRGEMQRSRCTACNACVAAMDTGGIRCVLDDP
jgi:2,4-dienoyl-CoA reductase-like NADH-dependent reductase (Old Yellow Enzyme family)